MKPVALELAGLAFLALGSACQNAYYSTMESFGVHKRDILVDRVEEGREAQQDAKEEIVDALEALKRVTSFDGGDLEEVYEELKDEYESSAEAVDEVESKIASIESVSKALFEEWAGEIDGMQNRELKAQSADMLEETKGRYEKLIRAMKTAEARMEPVLVAFKDHVTFLKHNLNAKAIASLQGQLSAVESNVASLIADMEKSIAEADAFIASMEQGAAK